MHDSVLISELTWTEIEEALQERPVALLPVGTMEAHGPHLPVATDTLLAIELARRGVKKLKGRSIPALILPAAPYAAASLGASFAGSIPVPAETATLLLRDICVATAQKFRAIAIVTINTEAAHYEALKKVVAETTRAGASVCFTDFTKKRWAEMLGETFLSGDHGGAFQTSLMMAAHPDQVRDSVRRSLPPIDGLAAALKKGAASFIEAGGEEAYFGDPTAATAEDGETHWENLTEILTLTIMEHLGSKA
jgi:creatinine amidohydrolase